MKNTILYLVTISILSSFQISQNSYPEISFCDLPNHINDTIMVSGIYQGMQEYWSFNSKENCEQELNVELDIFHVPMKHKTEKLFRKVHNEINSNGLELKILGRFVDEGVYGHLGSNDAMIHVIQILEIKEL